jgi:hypothetical protein
MGWRTARDELGPTDETSHFRKTPVDYFKASVDLVKAFVGARAKSLELLIDEDHRLRDAPRFTVKTLDLNVRLSDIRFQALETPLEDREQLLVRH